MTISKKSVLSVSLFVLILWGIVLSTFANPPTSPYSVSQNIVDPLCPPNGTNCYVASLSIGDTVGNNPDQNGILYTNASGQLVTDSLFTRDAVTKEMNMSRTYTDSFSKDWTTGFKAIQDIGTGFPGTGIVANDNVGNSVNISILDGSAYSIDSGVFNIQAQDATGNNNTFVGYAQGGQWSIQNTTGASSSIGMAANTINLLVNDGTPNIDYGFDIAGGYVKWRYGDNYYRLPSSLPSVGQVLGVSAIFGNTTQLDWITVSGGGSGSPAGSNGQVQYNNAGSLGGVNGVTFDGTNFDAKDNVFRIVDNSDTTKRAIFEVSGIDAGTTRTYTFPNTAGTIALTSDFSGYLKNSIGISGGTTLVGGTASGENLTLSSTSNATKGKILFGTSAYDEVNNRLGIGTTTPTSSIEIANGGTLKLGGGTAMGQGNILMNSNASIYYDSNVTYLGSNSQTMGMIASSTPAFLSSNGPSIFLRGNSYGAISGQRGIAGLMAGNPSSPIAGEGELRFYTGANAVRMVIGYNGNVGIGTATPLNKLDVYGDLTIGNGAVDAALKYNSTVAGGGSEFVIQPIYSGTSIVSLRPAAGSSLAPALRLTDSSTDAGGSHAFSFGTGSASLPANAWNFFSTITGSANANSWPIYFGVSNPSKGRVVAMTIDNTANVGIGTISPSYRFSVSDTTTAGIVGSFTNSDGTCTLDPGDVSGWSCPSDLNLKKDIETLTSGSLDNILALRPVTYRLRNEDNSTDLSTGLIAQEVQTIFPKLVKTQIDGTLALNYGGLTPYMISAIQEMNLRITEINDIEKPNTWRDALIAWFANITNGITDLYAKVFHAERVETQELCVGTTCLNETQVQQILQVIGSTPLPVNNPGGPITDPNLDPGNTTDSGDGTATDPGTSGDSGTPPSDVVDPGSSDPGVTPSSDPAPTTE